MSLGHSPGSVSWSVPHASLIVHHDPAFTTFIVAKVIADRATGIFILPAINSPAWRLLSEAATIKLTIAKGQCAFPALTIQPNVPLCAFIVDDWSAPPAVRRTIQIGIPPQWDQLMPPNAFTMSFNVSQWRRYTAYHPDEQHVIRVLDMVEYGVDYGYQGPRHTSRQCPIHKTWGTHGPELRAARTKELAKGFRSGNFPSPPLWNLLCSPVKAAISFLSAKLRHVNNMSYPHDGSSVNDYIPTSQELDLPAQAMTTFDTAVQLLLRLGEGTTFIVFDVCSAYKLIALRLADLHLQGEQTPDGFSFATRLNFGGRSAGWRWNDLGSMFEFILRHHADLESLIRFVDDFLDMLAPDRSAEAAETITRVKRIGKDLGVPLDKFQCGTTVKWLGHRLCSTPPSIAITDERREFMCSWLATALASSAPYWGREILSAAARMNFCTAAVPDGRTYLASTFAFAAALMTKRIAAPLSPAVKIELRWWHTLISDPSWSGRSLLFDRSWLNPPAVTAYTDACKLGRGAHWKSLSSCSSWFAAPWPPEAIEAASTTKSIDMVYLEFLTIVELAWTAGPTWSGLCIRVRTDSKDTVGIMASRRSGIPRLNGLLRSLYLATSRFNFSLRTDHIPGDVNTLADHLSRQKISHFLSQCPDPACSPTTILAPIIPT
jgi:hypothetical protein